MFFSLTNVSLSLTLPCTLPLSLETNNQNDGSGRKSENRDPVRTNYLKAGGLFQKCHSMLLREAEGKLSSPHIAGVDGKWPHLYTEEFGNIQQEDRHMLFPSDQAILPLGIRGEGQFQQS